MEMLSVHLARIPVLAHKLKLIINVSILFFTPLCILRIFAFILTFVTSWWKDGCHCIKPAWARVTVLKITQGIPGELVGWVCQGHTERNSCVTLGEGMFPTRLTGATVPVWGLSPHMAVSSASGQSGPALQSFLKNS